MFVVPLYHAFRVLVPEPQDRTPLTWAIAPYVLSHYVPFVLLAYLTRRPNTYFYRLALFPIVVSLILSAAYAYHWPIPSLNVYNWGQGLLAEVLVTKAIEYAFTPIGILKIGETQPGITKGKAIANGHANAAHSHSRSPFSGLFDAIEVIHTLRGLQFKFGLGTYIPPETRDTTNRSAFLRSTFINWFTSYLLLDFLEKTVKLFPGLGTPGGGTIFYPSLPPLQRYAVSTVLHMLTGLALLAGFNFMYYLMSFIAVGIVGTDPTSWPPPMGNPWTADSMHILWSKEWHQFLRRTFLVGGGYPGKWIAGDLGLVLGTFVASGLFHELGCYTMGRGIDHTVTLFFALQGPLLISERIWRRITGKRVGGFFGRSFVYFVMFVCGQPLTDSWHRRGLAGGMVIPPFASPARVILPIILRFIIKYILY